MNTYMSEDPQHHHIGRPSVALAGLLSCSVVCAAVVGAITVPLIVVVLALAAAIGAVSYYEHEPRAEPFSVASRVKATIPVIDAPRVREATRGQGPDTGHSDVA
ncbi:MAG TPA: hypothetical protein VM121_09900 [Acidimicrobiales bacterium]|nr:hypothetical protein [Acidimicrobiales bacterium]